MLYAATRNRVELPGFGVLEQNFDSHIPLLLSGKLQRGCDIMEKNTGERHKRRGCRMKQRQREQVQRGCAVGTVVLLAWLCRVLPLEGMPSGLQEACGILRSLLYLSLFAGWGISCTTARCIRRCGGCC